MEDAVATTTEPEKAPRQGRHASEQEAAVSPYIQMENVSDKLNLLDYNREFCVPRNQKRISRWMFAMPAQNPSMQFQLFLDLCSWLMTKVTGDQAFFRVDKFDDPNTSVNQLMLALRKLNFGLDFPSSKLKQAHGEAACTVLDFLTERACEKCFVWQKPEYPPNQDEEAEVDEEADVGDVEDEVEAEMEDEAMFQEPTYGIPEDEDPEYKEAHQILKSGIDPVTWQTELERVLPKLRLATVAGGNEWRAHIEQTKQHGDKIRDVLPQTEKQLQVMRDRMADAREKINLKENYINKQFDQKKENFQALKEELKKVEVKYQESAENVNKLTSDLSGIAEQLAEIKSTMNDRGNSMTDTSPLVQMKQALKQLKQEVVSFDLQIGVVGHTLMQRKLRHGNLSDNSKGYKMRGKRDTSKRRTDFDDDSDMESI